MRVLRVIADSHSPLTVSGPSGSSWLFVDHVTVAMVAVAYVLSQPGVGGVILGSINSKRYGCYLRMILSYNVLTMILF